MKILKILCLTVVMVLLPVTVFMSCTDVDKGVLKIGIVGAYTGDFSEYSKATVNEIQRITNRVNQMGGIDGYTLKIIEEDDMCSEEKAIDIADKMLKAKVIAVIGHTCSNTTEIALPEYTKVNIPVISPASSKTNLTTSGKFPVFFRTIAPSNKQGEMQVRFLIKNLRAYKVAIIYQDVFYGEGLAIEVKANLELNGGKTVLYEKISNDPQEYKELIDRIKASDVDAVMYGGFSNVAAQLVIMLREEGFDKPIIGGLGMFNQSFLKKAGKAAEGIFVTGPVDLGDTSLYKEVAKGYQKKYNEAPGLLFTEGRVAFKVIEQAIRSLKGEEINSTTVINAIRSRSFKTIMGDIRFNNQGDLDVADFNVYRVVNGNYLVLNLQ